MIVERRNVVVRAEVIRRVGEDRGGFEFDLGFERARSGSRHRFGWARRSRATCRRPAAQFARTARAVVFEVERRDEEIVVRVRAGRWQYGRETTAWVVRIKRSHH